MLNDSKEKFADEFNTEYWDCIGEEADKYVEE